MKIRNLLATLIIVSVALMSGCKKNEYQATVGVCPLVVSTIPVNGAVDVPLNQVVSATFNEKMNPATITTSTFILVAGTTKSGVKATTVVDGTIAYSGMTAFFTPSSPLTPNTTYTGTVTTGCRDLIGNALNTNYVWTFSTDAPPTVTTDPANNAVDVLLNKIIIATFSVPMDSLTLKTPASTFTIKQGSSLVPGRFSYTNNTAIFIPTSPLSPFTTYTGTITTGAKNLLGTPLAADYVWTFKTIPQLIVSSNPLIGGTTTGGGTFAQGSAVTVTAIPNAGYTFANWTDSVTIVSTSASYQFNMAGNKTLVANFTITPFTVAVSSNPVLGGTTSGSGTFNSGATVAVTAVANAGYSFTNWTEGGISVSTTAAYTFIIAKNRILVANYTAIPYTVALSSNPLTGGTTTGGGVFNSGSSVTVTALANAGYTFTNWTEGATIVSTSSNYIFTIVGNRTLVANFTVIAPSQLTVILSSNPLIGGTTTGAGSFNSGTSVSVTATPGVGYAFSNWTEGANIVSSSSNYTFTIIANRTLVANFTIIPASQFTVVLSSNPLLGGTTTGAGSFNSGTSVSVTATPGVGYTFTNWTEGANIVSSSSNYTFTIISNRTLVANFTVIPPSQFAVNLSSNPSTGGTTTGGGSFNSGASVSVTATPNVGYTFSNWTEGLIVVSSGSNYTFTISGNRTLVANFTAIVSTYTLNVTAVSGTVVKNPNQATYNSGVNVVLTATPATGYVFTSWSGDATGSTNPLTVTMNSNKNITANFTAVVNAYTLNVTAVNGTVVKNPDQPTYNSGLSVQLTATANSGYTFTSWSGDATGSVNPLTVVMNSNKNITANFTLNAPVGPGDIVLGGAGNFEILTMAGISTTGVTSITGDIGVSPMAATGITGFGLIMDTNGQSSHTPIVTGSVYASDYAPPTPANLTVAVADMLTAFTTANNLVTPAPIVDLYAGDISGRTLPAGLYKWSTGVLVTNAGVTLTGGPNDTWVFQIAQDLTVNSSAIITLLGGAQAKNIFWVVSGQALLGTNVNFSGNILSKTLISLNTGTIVTGRLLAQTAVTLNTATVIMP